MKYLLLFFTLTHALALDTDKLADAIYKAEGGTKTRYPYGIQIKNKRGHYIKISNPRAVCLRTIDTHRRLVGATCNDSEFITSLSYVYCPPVSRRPVWLKNVLYFYNK